MSRPQLRTPRKIKKIGPDDPKPGSLFQGKEVIYSRNYWKDEIWMHLRTPSPSPDEVRAAKWAESIKRESVSHITRTIPKGLPVPPSPPVDPHTTWALNNIPVFGLEPNVVPSTIDLHSPRVGRAFRWCHEGKQESTPLAIFPADPINRLCPPFPGVRPDKVYDPWDPSTCFSDGSLGKWDPRYFPQLFEEARPWLGYHRSPWPVAWWYKHTGPVRYTESWPDPRMKNYDRPLIPHYLPVTEYFEWNRPSRPEQGGRWQQELLAPLFVTRTEVERHTLVQVQNLLEVDPSFNFTQYQLPWYDELTYDEAIAWTTWQEGRDALGRTCRYIAELEAFGHWVQTLRAIKVQYPTRMSPPCSLWWEFMGTWAATIRTKEEWMTLHQGFVPIYIVSELPLDHPLVLNGIGVGDLDGGERYRINKLDAQHNMPNIVISLPKFSLTAPQCLQVPVLDRTMLPAKLISPFDLFDFDPPPDLLRVVFHDPSHSEAAHQPWTSYLFNDPRALAQTPLEAIRDDHDRWTIAYKTQCLQFTFVVPVDGLLDMNQDPHPFFWTYDVTHEVLETHYEELFDQEFGYFSFRLVRGSPLAKARQLPYVFSYPHVKIVIHSSSPFPGRSPLLGRVGKVPSESLTPDNDRRVYFKKRLSPSAKKAFLERRLQPDHVWIPFNDDDRGQSSPLAADTSTSKESISQDDAYNIQAGEEDPLIDQLSQLEDLAEKFEPVAVPCAEVTSLKPQIELLYTQRNELQSQIKRRLFRPIKGIVLQSDILVPWRPSSTSDAIVWPLRIACLHGDASLDMLLSMLSQKYSVHPKNVLVVCSYQEFDLSYTADLGLRYAEDALWLRVLLHGVRVDGRFLEVYPLKALKGSGKILEQFPHSQRDNHSRAQRVKQLMELHEIWPTESQISLSALQEVASVLYNQEVDATTCSTDCHSYPVFSELPSLRDDTEDSNKCGHFSFFERQLWLDGQERPQDAPLASAFEGTLDSLSYVPQSPHSNPTAPLVGSSQQKDAVIRHRAEVQRQNNRPKPYSIPSSAEATTNNPSTSRVRRGVRPYKRDARQAMDPASAPSMNSKQQRTLPRALQKRAAMLQGSCIFSLEGLPTVESKQALDVMSNWWNWLDKCHHYLDTLQNKPQFQDHDWDILPSVFQQLYRVRGLYGKQWELCHMALEKRPCWVSKCSSSADALCNAASETEQEFDIARKRQEELMEKVASKKKDEVTEMTAS